MSHKPKSTHCHILMSGHNPEHRHHSSHSRGGAAHHAKPCDVLMRERHYSGGMANPSHYAEGGVPEVRSFSRKLDMTKRFAKGGHCYSRGGEAEYSEGGETKRDYGEKPLTGQLRRGGKAHHEHKKKRQHHYWGQEVIGRIPLFGDMANDIARTAGTLESKKFGGDEYAPKSKMESIANGALTGHLKKGGRAHHREGEPVADNSVRQEHKRGGKSKRQHHYWGQDFFGRLPLVGGLANTIANTAGTLDPNQYGGSEYVADTSGRKAADIASTIGNFGTNLALSAYGGKKAKGGKVHHRKHRQHHAAGGAGKVRKGMMTEDGRMKHYDYDK